MPFEFNGNPPALLGATEAEGSTTPAVHSDSHDTSPSRTSFQSTFGPSSSAFGLSKSKPAFGSASAFGATTSFGSAAGLGVKTAFADTATAKTIATSPVTSHDAASSASGKEARKLNIWQSDPLSQAINRAANARPAMFNPSDIAADKYLQGAVLRSEVQSQSTIDGELKLLQKEFSIAEKHTPRIAQLLRTVFADVLALQKGAGSSGITDQNSFWELDQPATSQHSPDRQRIFSSAVKVTTQDHDSDNIFARPPQNPKLRMIGAKEHVPLTRKPWFCEACPLPCRRGPEILTREDADQRFRFMDLPPEIRLWIYHDLLTPTGCVRLLSCKHHLPLGVSPKLAPAILRVSKLIAHEAKGIIQSNQIIVTALVDQTTRLPLHRKQLPAHLLSNITRMTIVLDVANRLTGFRDISALQAATFLKELTICALAYDSQLSPKLEGWQHCLSEILERIPLACTVVYGSVLYEEADQVDGRVDEILHENALLDEASRESHELKQKGRLGEVAREILREAAGLIQWGEGGQYGGDGQGRLSGSTAKMVPKDGWGIHRWS